MERRVLGIVGSYRRGGIVDQAVSEVLEAAREAGAATEKVYLLDCDIAFCDNCRGCTQAPGEAPGFCVHRDGMSGLIERIEAADTLVLGTPVNFSAVTALFKRFQERLVCYAYWPWGQAAPKMRRPGMRKEAVLVTASAMPGLMARLTTGAMRSLKFAARTVGARPVARLYVGLAAGRKEQPLSAGAVARARRAGKRLTR